MPLYNIIPSNTLNSPPTPPVVKPPDRERLQEIAQQVFEERTCYTPLEGVYMLQRHLNVGTDRALIGIEKMVEVEAIEPTPCGEYFHLFGIAPF